MRRPNLLAGGLVVLGLVVAGLVVWRLWSQAQTGDGPQRGELEAVPVEVAGVVLETVRQGRMFSGTLEASARFRVAAKVGGRVERLTVALADAVSNGQVVAELEADEYEHAVLRAQADLAVGEAELNEARAVVEITQRTLERQDALRERGVASEAAVDEAQSAHLAAQAQVAVAKAGVARAQAEVATARTQLGYTRVAAVWDTADHAGKSNETATRVVSERLIEAGDTVSANTPLLEIVELDPLRAVVFAAERDYASLFVGQDVELRTDAYPGERFAAKVGRVSPVFASGSRQARVELDVPNVDRRLRPGMFIRARIVLAVAESATVVPEAAVIRRDEADAVFVLDESAEVVRLVPVTRGLSEAGRVQVLGDALRPGQRVVTLGQRLLDDGVAVRRSEDTIGSIEAVSTEAP